VIKKPRGQFDSAVLETVDEGLRILGEAVKPAIYYHLETHHKVNREEIPEKLETFHKALEGLFGFGAKPIEKLIAKKLYSKLGLSFEPHEDWTLIDYVKDAKKAKGG